LANGFSGQAKLASRLSISGKQARNATKRRPGPMNPGLLGRMECILSLTLS
jgi:hypothetical protein